MSYMKRWLEDCSEELGHDGEINDEVMEQASPARCPRAWQRAMDRAPRLRIEAMKALVTRLVQEAGEQGITVAELQRRLGIEEHTR